MVQNGKGTVYDANRDISDADNKLSVIGKIIQNLVKVENFSIVILLISLTVMTTLQVAFRYIFQISAPWTDELGRYLMIWMVFIGAGWATHAENHITINVIDIVFKNKAIKNITDTIMAITLVVFSIVYLHSAFIYIPQVIRSGEVTIATKIPMWIPQGILVIGGLLICIHSIEVLFRKFKVLIRGGGKDD